MNSEFENDLVKHPIRPVPPHWKAEILQAAKQAKATTAPAARDSLLHQVWTGVRELFWPSPVAWGALAAVWLVSFGVGSFTGRETAPASAAAVSPAELHLAKQQQHWIREELGAGTLVAMPQPRHSTDPDPSPRSDAPMNHILWRNATLISPTPYNLGTV